MTILGAAVTAAAAASSPCEQDHISRCCGCRKQMFMIHNPEAVTVVLDKTPKTTIRPAGNMCRMVLPADAMVHTGHHHEERGGTLRVRRCCQSYIYCFVLQRIDTNFHSRGKFFLFLFLECTSLDLV